MTTEHKENYIPAATEEEKLEQSNIKPVKTNKEVAEKLPDIVSELVVVNGITMFAYSFRY